MIKIFVILFGIYTNIIFSQDIQSTCKFRKYQQKRNFIHYELDSLVLYKNGDFHKTYSYNYHEIKYKEIKGKWKIENETLILLVHEELSSPIDSIWKESFEEYQYKIKRKKLEPLITKISKINSEGKTINYYYLPSKKLKL